MTSGRNNIDNESGGKFLIMQATIDDISHPYDEKINTYDSTLDNLKSIIKNMMDHN